MAPECATGGNSSSRLGREWDPAGGPTNTETGSEATRVMQSREETPKDTHKAILGQFGKRGRHGPEPGPASEQLPLLYHAIAA